MRERMNRQMVVPPWADRIEIEPNGAYLVITGTGTSFQPIPKEVNIGWDRDLLRGFDAGLRRKRDKSRKALHLLFAGARTLEQQVDFMHDFGPILATRISWGSEKDILIAHQGPDCPELRAEAVLADLGAYSCVFGRAA